MTDNMRFTPDSLQIKQGETVKFVVRNDGRFMHEFVPGTRAVLSHHAEVMARQPHMAHGCLGRATMRLACAA